MKGLAQSKVSKCWIRARNYAECKASAPLHVSACHDDMMALLHQPCGDLLPCNILHRLRYLVHACGDCVECSMLLSRL